MDKILFFERRFLIKLVTGNNEPVKHLLFFIPLLISTISWGQTITTENSDCANAIIFQDSIYGPLKIPKGYGNKLEIKGHNIKNKYFFTREHNTLWIKIVFNNPTKFEFEIAPEKPNEDFDFSLFKITGPNFCDSIATNKVLPVRSNLCRRKPEEKSVTGLKAGYTNNYSAAGPNPSFSAPIDVNAGEEYYLVIDSPYGTTGGFSIDLQYENIPVVEPEPEPEPEPVAVTPKLYLKLKGDDGVNIESAKILARGLRKGDQLIKDSAGFWMIDQARKLNSYKFTVTKKGYKQQEFEYFHRIEGDSTLTFTLEKLKIGSKLKFEKISFMGDQAVILPSSKDDLEKLTLFLKQNPNIDVEIGGHVNAQNGRNLKRFRELSEERAKAIFDHLVGQGINESQLTYKGYGNSKMIYPKASTESQAQANRRVEIIVTKIR